ncbi:E3 ubiquitin-protein ligase rnf213-alpha-like isoform X3 [Vanacampus margaritifer]
MAMMYPDFSEDTLPEKPIVNVVQCDDDTVLDTTALVLCCMQSPVGLLRDQQGRGCRSTQRLDTLLMLLSDGEQVTGDFLQTLKRRLYLMLASESNFSSATRDWVIKVASNMDALQDGGTFCSETRTILVRKYFAEGRDFTFSIPFSGSIKDYLEDLWVHALRNEGHTQQRFLEFFSKTPLGQYMAKDTPDMQYEFFHLYLRDFLFLTMKVSA